ncbi:MAG: hypothetical protein HQ551_04595 [Desulfobacteraceae bacterium]|nr:hypothetical protein [Desulfobacteraceae bacterium]
MEIQVENIPQELKDHPQWVVWKWEKNKSGKATKPPYNFKTGRRANKTDPKIWASFHDVVEALERGYDGVGFCFTEDDPFCGIDLDKCIDPVSGEIESWALKIIKDFDSYTEKSPSGTGLKIFSKGKLPGGGIKTEHVELYDRAAYFTVTGEAYHADS